MRHISYFYSTSSYSQVNSIFQKKSVSHISRYKWHKQHVLTYVKMRTEQHPGIKWTSFCLEQKIPLRSNPIILQTGMNYKTQKSSCRRERKQMGSPGHNVKFTQMYTLVIKLTRYTNSSNLFLERTLHVSDSSSVHHQESSTVHTAIRIYQTGYADCLLASSQHN